MINLTAQATSTVPTLTSEARPTRARAALVEMETNLLMHNPLDFLDQERVSNFPEAIDQ